MARVKVILLAVGWHVRRSWWTDELSFEVGESLAGVVGAAASASKCLNIPQVVIPRRTEIATEAFNMEGSAHLQRKSLSLMRLSEYHKDAP